MNIRFTSHAIDHFSHGVHSIFRAVCYSGRPLLVAACFASLLGGSAGCYEGITPCTSDTCEVIDAGSMKTVWTTYGQLNAQKTEVYYRFYLDRWALIELNVDGLGSNADIEVICDLNANGLNDGDDGTMYSQRGQSSAQDTQKYAPGVYFLHIYDNGQVTDYRIEIATHPLPEETPTPSTTLE